jgi:hypothetical protein
MLPADIANNIETPDTPAKRPPTKDYESPVGPISTSTQPVVTELPDDLELD